MSKSSAPEWGNPKPVPDPQGNLPPWDRDNPAYGVGAGKDEKTSHTVTVRLTTKEFREIQKIVQHRKYPVIETQSDAVRAGLSMFRYWYAINHNKSRVQELDVEMWENERLAKRRFRDRVLNILEGIEAEMKEAQRLGYANRLKDLRAELGKYRKELTDEELRGKANLLYVEYVPRNDGSEKA